MKTFFASFALFLLSTTVFAQKEYSVSGFDGIDASGPFSVTLVKGGTEKATVNISDKEMLEKIEIITEGGILKIRMRRNNNWWNGSNYDDKGIPVVVTYKSINRISVSASADVYAKETIKSETMRLSASSAGDIKVDIEANQVFCDVSSGGDADVSGSAKSLEAEASSGADLDAANLKVETCEANASSGAGIKVYVTNELNAHASSGGDVTYKGSPQRLRVNSSSGGDIKQNN